MVIRNENGWCEGQKCDIYTSLTKWTFNIRVEPNWISTYMSLTKECKKGRQLKENSVDHEAGGLGGETGEHSWEEF